MCCGMDIPFLNNMIIGYGNGQEDFSFSKDGSTAQKLDVLENMMGIKRNVTMIGDFTDRGPKLFTEKAAGNICGCIGFVKDRNTGLNVPNTLMFFDERIERKLGRGSF